jgi:Carboxypeptidase regulatory-like domain
MATSRRFTVALFLWIVALAAVGRSVYAQEVTASIVGTITDSSGAPITGADVTASDTDRGTVRTIKTNEQGAYNFVRLPIGNYTVRVTASGFQTATHPQFSLSLNQTARIDVQMKVGQVSESVEVQGAAPVLQTESTEVSTLISANAVTSIPMAGRNYLQLGLLAPGTTTNNPQGINEPHNLDGNGRPFINGNREQANQYFLDGILNSEDKNNETSFMPNVDAIGEFNLITQNASAEFGNYEGGVISVSTKAGTNHFHGSIFEFWRNDKLDANLPSNGWTKGIVNEENTLGHAADGTILKPEFRYNQFGGTVGGPIFKDKLFFFGDYQGLRDLHAGATGALLLTKSMRAGNFGQLCTDLGGAFTGAGGACTGGTGTLQGIQLQDPGPGPTTGNIIPNNDLAAYIAGGANPNLQEGTFMTNLLSSFGKYYPLPQIDSVAADNYFYNSGTSINTDQGDLRLDFNISEKDHLFGRYSQGHLRNPAFSGCVFCAAGSNLGADQPMRNAVVNWTHTFTSNLLNEARLGFNAVQFNQNVTQTAFLGNVGEQLGIANANFESPGLLLIGPIPTPAGAEDADLGNGNLFQIFHTTQGQFNDNVSIISGHHTIKTGFQYIRQRQDYQYAGNNGGLGNIPIGAQSGSGLSDLWLGLAAVASPTSGGGVRDTYLEGSSLFKHRGNVFAGYVQDDFHVTRTLTLNLGLRFEDHTPLQEVQNRMVNFGLYTGTIYTPDGRDGTAKFSNPGLYNNYLGGGDWEPRFGFAWSPASLGGKTVIRGGYGISAFMEGQGTNEQLTMNPPLGISAMNNLGGTIAAGYPSATTLQNNCATVSITCYAGLRIRITDQNFKPAMTQQWNLTIQHQFSNSVTAQIGYVGQHGTHLLNFEDIAQRVGLNASGQVAKPGQDIVAQRAGPYLGGGNVMCDVNNLGACGAAGSLYRADQSGALAGANMANASQRYDALQAVLMKRMGNGLEGQVAYTYSKCLSNSPGYFGTGWGSTGATSSGGQPGPQNIYDPRSDWGPCFFNQKHVLASYVNYALPIGRGKQFGKDMNPALNAVLGDWEISAIVSAHSGNSLTLNTFGGWGSGFAGDVSNTNGIGPATLSERPDCAGPVHIANRFVPVTPGTATSGGTAAYIQWFDSTGISNPTVNALGQGHFGTCSVGNITGPKFFDADLGLHKDFRVAEGKTLQFRFEAINAFNHPVWTFSGGPAGGSFDPPANGLGGTGQYGDNPTFGRITGSQSARTVQLGLKFIY